MTEVPKRVQLKRTKGWKIPPNTVSVARPTKWGNPFASARPVPSRADAVRKYREMAQASDELTAAVIAELRGKNLACWCPLEEPCHADVLLDLANESKRLA